MIVFNSFAANKSEPKHPKAGAHLRKILPWEDIICISAFANFSYHFQIGTDLKYYKNVV
jgi:hypothetical protein